MVRRSPSCTASTAEILPLMTAGPMFRAPRPEIVSGSMLTPFVFCCEKPVAADIISATAMMKFRESGSVFMYVNPLVVKLSGSLPASRLRLDVGLAENGIVQGDVGLDGVVVHLLFELASLGAHLDREGEVPPVDLLVVPENGFGFLFSAADHPFCFNLDGHVIIGIHIIVVDVAVGDGDF